VAIKVHRQLKDSCNALTKCTFHHSQTFLTLVAGVQRSETALYSPAY
jgi:hypothetical protein